MTEKTYPPVSGTLERYRDVHAQIQAENRPVAWGRYRNSLTASARVSKLAKHKNNDGLGLRFALRTLADDVYIFAYLTDEQATALGTTMTYGIWRDVHGFPDDLEAVDG